MAAYGEFAALYDLLMDDVDYDAWAEYYLALLERAGVAPKRLCDCACGTGAMSVRFARRGIRVTGADLSGEMLEQAQARAREWGVQAMFVRQDMCALTLPRPVDAVVCACDGVNYLLDDARLNAFFRHVRDALRPGGALAFDVSSAYKLEHVLGDNFFGEDREEAAYLWSNRFDATGPYRHHGPDLLCQDSRMACTGASTEVHVQKAHERGAHRRAAGAKRLWFRSDIWGQTLTRQKPTTARPFSGAAKIKGEQNGSEKPGRHTAYITDGRAGPRDTD